MATSDDMREQIRSLTEKFDGLEKKVDGLEKKVDGLGLRVGGLEQKVDLLPTRDDLKVFKDEIINNFRILAEDAKASARLAAEGFDGTLKRIERDLGDLKQEVVNKFADPSLELGVLGVEMWWCVIREVHFDDDAVEATDLRHRRI